MQTTKFLLLFTKYQTEIGRSKTKSWIKTCVPENGEERTWRRRRRDKRFSLQQEDLSLFTCACVCVCVCLFVSVRPSVWVWAGVYISVSTMSVWFFLTDYCILYNCNTITHFFFISNSILARLSLKFRVAKSENWCSTRFDNNFMVSNESSSLEKSFAHVFVGRVTSVLEQWGFKVIATRGSTRKRSCL